MWSQIVISNYQIQYRMFQQKITSCRIGHKYGSDRKAELNAHALLLYFKKHNFIILSKIFEASLL